MITTDGREMGIFTTVDVIGQGPPLLMPKGAWIVQTLQRWIEDEEERRGYMRTKTPLMAKKDLYIISDHWNHYKEGMFVLGDENKPGEEVMALRPMTCPFQYYVYKQSQKSYRDLPCRYGETSTLFRNEDSGEMHGLTRVRQFTISEGHLICMPEQIEEEFRGCVDLAKYCLTTLGLEEDVTYRLSLGSDDRSKYIAMKRLEPRGDMMRAIGSIASIYGAGRRSRFYGPKRIFRLKCIWKEDTMITTARHVPLERFDMTILTKKAIRSVLILFTGRASAAMSVHLPG